MAARQKFLNGDDGNGADQADPFASLVGGLPLPAFDSPVGDTNVDTSQQTQQQQQAQQAVQTPSGQGVTDPRVQAPTTPTTPTSTQTTQTTSAATPPVSGYSFISDNNGDPLYRGIDGHTYHYVRGSNGTYSPELYTGAPPAMNDRDIAAHIRDFGLLHPNANPSVTKDPGYWLKQIKANHPNGQVDWDYWEGRMMAAEGPPEGPPQNRNPNTTTPGGGPQFVTSSTPVGSDPFSQQITGGLSDLISHGGMTPEEQSLYGTLGQIISSGGRLPNDAGIDQANLEKARENESNAFTSQLADTRDELAARGLISEPGIGQGEEASAINRINRNIAPAYAQSVRDITTASAERQNARVASALTTITGLSEDASHNLLNSLGQGTQRQTALANIALQSLDQNIQWNEFLANYGLTRDQLLYQVQQGNIASIMPILALFSQLVGHTTGGFV